MQEENMTKILAQASAFLKGLSVLDNMRLDPDLRTDARRELAQKYLSKGAGDLFPGIDELIIGEIVVRTPQYETNKIHHSHTLDQLKKFVEPRIR